MTALPRGVSQDADGWRTRLMVRGRRYSQHWPPDTPLETLTTWLSRLRALSVLGRMPDLGAVPRTFREDATAYLTRVRSLPTYRERARDIGLWVDVFGDRPRVELTAADIREISERWLAEGPRMRQVRGADGVTRWQPVAEPLSASSVNHRLRALANLWTVLDGRRAPNPVHEVPEAREADAEPRAIDYGRIRAILGAVPEGCTRARLALIAYAGLPHHTVMQIRPAHIDWRAKTLWVAGRRKGAGTAARVIPLIRPALEALRVLARLEGWGGFSSSSLRKALHRACRRLDVPLFRPYDLRHSWLTLVAASSGDERAVQELAGHTDIRTTRRYTLASVARRLEQAVAAAHRAAGQARRAKKPVAAVVGQGD